MGYVYEQHRMVTGLTEKAAGRLILLFQKAGFKTSTPTANGGSLEFEVFDKKNGMSIRVFSWEALADGFMRTGTSVSLIGSKAGKTVFDREIQNNPDVEETSIAPIMSDSVLEGALAERSLTAYLKEFTPKEQAEMNVKMQGEAQNDTDKVAAEIVLFLRKGV